MDKAIMSQRIKEQSVLENALKNNNVGNYEKAFIEARIQQLLILGAVWDFEEEKYVIEASHGIFFFSGEFIKRSTELSWTKYLDRVKETA